MKTVEIESTSKHSASCTDIPIRDGGEQIKLVFRPQIVDNPSNPTACVKGRFLYQRKGKNDEWEDFDNLPLSTLRKGERFQLELKSGELYFLLRELGALYRLHKREGVPQGKTEFMRMEHPLSEFLDLTESDLTAFLTTHAQDAVKTLRLVLRWLSKQKIPLDVIDDPDELPGLNALVGLANLRSLLKTWAANVGNREEEFWQKLFARHSFVLSQLFSYPIILIKGKAYVGGKDLSNSGGKLVDFLCRTESSGAAVLIEIKTPLTPLLGREYRQGVFSPSDDMSEGISQVIEYRENLMNNIHALRADNNELLASEPYCLVVMGDMSRELNSTAKKRSFERFRERLMGVRVLTFDEVYKRIETLVEILERV